jgi:hypothetical protein
MGNRALLFWPLAAWLLFAGLALWLTHGSVSVSSTLDTDSAMRLAEVRDLVAGQGWFDTIQHRMNTPYGLPMHWSRAVDAPLALLCLISERFALIAWPLLLFAALLLLLARLADRLAGRRALIAVLVLALLSPALYGTFTPGNIDHHGLQLVLMLTMLLGLVEQRPRLTAIAISISLAVGLETLPYALVAIALSLRSPDRSRRFGLTLAAGALLLLAATTADPYRWTPVCDTYSLFYGVLLGVGGLGAAAISFLPRHRLPALGMLAVGLLAVAALLNPVCLAGPYAGLDGRLQSLFFDRINEAHPVWVFFHLSPSETIGGYVYALLALALCLVAPLGRARTIVVALSAVALAVATLQYRATPFALVFVLPGLAAALASLTENAGLREARLAVLLLIANSAGFFLAASLLEGERKVSQRAMAFDAQQDCGHEQDMTVLKSLPPGRVAGFVDQGPAILAYTRHSAIAGPYHRNAAGILDSYEIFAGKDPRAVLDRRGIDYLMTCRAAPDWDFYRARDGLVTALARGDAPDWLLAAGTNGDVTVYRIKR